MMKIKLILIPIYETIRLAERYATGFLFNILNVIDWKNRINTSQANILPLYRIEEQNINIEWKRRISYYLINEISPDLFLLAQSIKHKASQLLFFSYVASG